MSQMSSTQDVNETRGSSFIRGNTRRDVDNTVKYELYCSQKPSQELANLLKDQMKCTAGDNQVDINLKPSLKQNLCQGSLRFDQNIEDEWLVVYLLYELSKTNPDLVIRVYDNDGDILLIEAAEYLPRWLESRKSKHRVFIHKGKLHIIPEKIDLKDLEKRYQSSTVTQASAHFIRDMNSGANNSATGSTGYMEIKTAASSPIQDAIQKQLSGLPDKKAWLSKKFKQLDEIISEDNTEDLKHLEDRFNETLNLATVMAMTEEDLEISSISSLSSSNRSSSSSWLTDQENAETT